jgi:hypothetical protein
MGMMIMRTETMGKRLICDVVGEKILLYWC